MILRKFEKTDEHPTHRITPNNHRVCQLRHQILDLIPRKPNNVASLNQLSNLPLADLISVYLNWVDRFIPPRKRTVSASNNFWVNKNSANTAYNLREFISLSEKGNDLNPYLSQKIRTDGFIQPTSEKPGISWKDKDMALNAYGLHHIHLHPVNGSGNRRGQSDILVFLDVYRTEIIMVTLGDHKSFSNGKLFHAATDYKAETGWDMKGVRPPRKLPDPIDQQNSVWKGFCSPGVSNNKIVRTSSTTMAGTSVESSIYADKCCIIIEKTENCILKKNSLAELFGANENEIPKNPDWSWSFWYGDLVLTDSKSGANILVQKWRR